MLKASLRGFLAHRARLLLSGLSVALSVAFIVGTLMFTDTIAKSSTDAARAAAADVTVTPAKDVNVHGPIQLQTLPVALVDRLSRIDGVAAARPDVRSTDVRVLDRDKVPLGGATVAQGWPQPVARLTSGRPPHGPAEVVLNGGTQAQLGDRVRVASAVHGGFDAVVVGLITLSTPNPGQTQLYVDQDDASTLLLGKSGVITSAKLTARPGVSNDQLKQRVSAVLGGGYDVRTRAVASGASTSIDGYRFALLGFAGLSLVVGTFLIVNTLSMLVAQRTAELGLLRALGAGRRQVRSSVLIEALLLGVAGSTVGLLGGAGIALVLKAVIGTPGSLVIRPLTPILGYLVGTGVTLLAGYLPARRAARISPMAALRASGAAAPPATRTRALIGALLLVAAIPLLLASQGLVALGMLVILAAVVVLGPALVRWCVPPLTWAFPRLYGTIGRLGRENTLRNPRRTGATAAALMIGVAVATLFSVYAASASASMDARVDRMLAADFRITAESGNKLLGGEQASFGPQVVETVRRVPGISVVVPELQSPVKLTAGGQRYNWVAYGDDPGFPAMLKEGYSAGDAAGSLASGKVILGQDTARQAHLSVGSTVTLQAPGGSAMTLTVGAIQHVEPAGGSIGRVRGAPMVGIDVMRQLAPRAVYTTVFANAGPGSDPAAVAKALRTALVDTPQVTVQDRAGYRKDARAAADGMLKLVYGLLALAIVVAILGVINTLAMSVVERTREIGLLRAVGMSRRQIRLLIQLESVVISVFGALLGLGLGLCWGLGVQRSQPALDVLVIPWSTLGAVIVGGALVGLVAAVLPAARAARMNVLAAISAQ